MELLLISLQCCCRLSDCPHPVIVLKDPNPRQLSALLDYMYTGQMSIKQEVCLLSYLVSIDTDLLTSFLWIRFLFSM